MPVLQEMPVYVLIPEIPFTIENVARAIKKRDEMGFLYTVVAVIEGAKYADGTKVIGKIVEDSPDPVRYYWPCTKSSG